MRLAIRRVLAPIVLLAALAVSTAQAQNTQAAANGSGPLDSPQAEQETLAAKFRALNWIKGPTTVPIGTNSKLVIPNNYVFLDAANTAKFNELNKNLGNGRESMVAPRDLHWAAFLEFSDEGYVKDNEKIDQAALLKTIKDNTEKANEVRQSRGYPIIHVLDWASPPAYNSSTKRLEWATLLEDNSSNRDVNFFTKVLGRHGYTSVVMVSDPSSLQSAETSLDQLLNGYSFNSGESYAEYRPGDKVAEYGLAALIVGGAAAVAAKKGLFGVIATFLAAAWKLVVAGVVAAMAWLRSLFAKKKA